MNVLVIVNGPPYGSELPFNALRLAVSLAKRDEVQLRLFLMGDAVGTAIDGQQLPDGYYHLDRMVASVVRKGAEVGCCGTCLDARSIGDDQLVDGARRSTMGSSPTGRSRPSGSSPSDRCRPHRRPLAPEVVP